MAFQEFLCPKARPVSGHELIRAEQIFSLREIKKKDALSLAAGATLSVGAERLKTRF